MMTIVRIPARLVFSACLQNGATSITGKRYMTLSRQLITLIVALFIIGLLGTLAISLNNTRHFLITQLESHAQDTATSLGLSLSPPMANNDLPTMNSMVDAIFDRGYYQEITIKRIDGSMLIERRNPLRIEGVPTWFVERIPLSTPEGEALVMSGWRQAATVHVRSHPGYAYAELWRNGMETLWWFSAVALGTLVLGLLMLRMVLRPLRAVEAQAEAICARDYRLQAKLPRTRELRRMVEAMNRMSSKVKLMFDEQAQSSERLREHAYKDPVTGLGNRRYFDTQLQHLMVTPEEFGQGALLLVQISDFKGFNDRHGYQAGDALLRRAAALISECCAPGKACSVTRLGGADFAVVAALTTASDAELLGSRHLPGAATTAYQFPGRYGNAGVCWHRDGPACAIGIGIARRSRHGVTRRADRRCTVVSL